MDRKMLWMRLSQGCSLGVVVCGLLTALLDFTIIPALVVLVAALVFRLLFIWENRRRE